MAEDNAEGQAGVGGLVRQSSTLSQQGFDFLARMNSGLGSNGMLDNRMLSMKLDEVAGMLGAGVNPPDEPPGPFTHPDTSVPGSAEHMPQSTEQQQTLQTQAQQQHQPQQQQPLPPDLTRTSSNVNNLTFDDLIRVSIDPPVVDSSYQQPPVQTEPNQPQHDQEPMQQPQPQAEQMQQAQHANTLHEALSAHETQQQQEPQQQQQQQGGAGVQVNVPPPLSGRSVEEIWSEIQGGKSSIPVGKETVAGFFDKLGNQYASLSSSIWPDAQNKPATAAAVIGDRTRGNKEELKQEVKQEAWQEALQAQQVAQQQTSGERRAAAAGTLDEQDNESDGSKRRGKKRKPDEKNDDERKMKQQQRMVKNRESAARSRERKQRYTAALEEKVGELTSANQQLRQELDRKHQEGSARQADDQWREQTGPLTRRKLRRYNSGPPTL